MKETIIIFDVHGTIVESNEKIKKEHAEILNNLKLNYKIGICSSDTIDRTLYQMDNLIFFDEYFNDNGSVYNKNTSIFQLNLENVHEYHIRNHVTYPFFQKPIKEFLNLISMQKGFIISGNLVEIRKGLVHLSCVGKQASKNERNNFIVFDKKTNFRNDLILKIKRVIIGTNLSVKLAGDCGIILYPFEYDKHQIRYYIDNSYNIVYFGNRYKLDEVDNELMQDSGIISHKIDNVKETYEILRDKYLK